MKTLLQLSTIALILNSCGAASDTTPSATNETAPVAQTKKEVSALKLNNPNCIDPDLTKVANTTSLMLCDGSIANGKFVIPEQLNVENLVAENIRKDVTIAGVTGTFAPETKIVKEEVEKVVEKIVKEVVTNTVEVPVEKIVTNTVEVEKIVTNTVQVPVEVIVEKLVDKIVEVEKIVTVTNTVEVEKIVTVTNTVEVPAQVNINPFDLRAGVTVAGVTGQLKANCRNRAALSVFPTGSVEYTGSNPTSRLTEESSDAFFSIIEGWGEETDCQGHYFDNAGNKISTWVLPSDADQGNCTPGFKCAKQDLMSGLTWVNALATVSYGGMTTTTHNWSKAVETCDNLVYNGHQDWRLPSYKELLQAYVNGISTAYVDAYSQKQLAYFTQYSGLYFWSSTTQYIEGPTGSDTTGAYVVALKDGRGSIGSKVYSAHAILCVR